MGIISSVKISIKKLVGQKTWSIFQFIKFYVTQRNGSTLNDIEQSIFIYRPNASTKEKVRLRCEMYWNNKFYGINYDEYFLWNVGKLNVEAKQSLFCTKIRRQYEDALNPDTAIYDDKYKTYTTYKKFFNREVIRVDNHTSKEEILSFLLNKPEIIIKPAIGMRGGGIYRVQSQGIVDNIEMIMKKIRKMGIDEDTNELIFEEVLYNNKEIASFYNKSLNTVRIHTLRVGDKVHVFLAVFKIGKDGICVDNGVCGGITTLVDINSGIIIDSKNHYGETYYVHPDTGQQIIGFKIPKWRECVELAKRLAMIDSVNRFIAWDLALTNHNQWVLVEGNGHGDNFPQLTAQYDLKRRLDKMLSSRA